MRTVGFPISLKEHENRRALIPEHLSQIKHPELLYFEAGYGKVLGYTDLEYEVAGARCVSRDEVLRQDIICDPKVGDADYLGLLKNQTVYGWVHAVLNRDIADKLILGKLTAYAWEDMNEMGRHVFWRNNEIAGEAAIMHAYLQYGVFPYNTKVAVLGRGNIARGAKRTLDFMGADVRVYDRHMEQLLRKELPEFDVLVNAVMWEKTRKDHVIYESDLKRMKRGAMIIDISCDRHGAIETSEPTSIESPVYIRNGIMHYVVDHTPALVFKTTSRHISEVVAGTIDMLVSESENEVLSNACIVKDGIVLDHKIIEFQGR